MNFHPEVLAEQQLSILARTAPMLSERDFYLAGGTAVALQLGHRRSVDFDWFLNRGVGDMQQFVHDFKAIGLDYDVQHLGPGALHGLINGVRVSLLEYQYNRLHPLKAWSEYGCQLASLDDLACMKLSAIAQRGAKKDFIDLYVLLKRGRSLADLLEMYQQKFEVNDISHLLYALCYFDDADNEPMPKMHIDTTWPAIKRAIATSVKRLAT